MSHPSEEVIQEARLRLQMRGQGSAAAERYRRLSHEFQADSEFDSFGLRQCLLEMDRLAGAPEPGGKGFLRRRFKVFVTPQQGAARASARALRAVEAILRRQDRRQRELEEKQIELESRIKKVEGR
jgi:hypothetical protein